MVSTYIRAIAANGDVTRKSITLIERHQQTRLSYDQWNYLAPVLDDACLIWYADLFFVDVVKQDEDDHSDKDIGVLLTREVFKRFSEKGKQP